MIADRGETWTPRDEGFRDGVEDEKLVVVVRVRRLVAIGSSSVFWVMDALRFAGIFC